MSDLSAATRLGSENRKARIRMDGLTGLRAIAAIWVIAYHYGLGPFGRLHLIRVFPFIGFGYLGVDLFFMLSGFVIWHVHGDDFRRPSVERFKRFMMLRVARLCPVYLFTLLLLGAIFLLSTAVASWHMNPANYTLHDFLINMTMLQTWGLVSHPTWNYPDWSVSAEWFCYFLFPFAALMFIGLKRAHAILIVATLFLVLAGVYLFAFGRTMNHAAGWMALTRALIEFLTGCLLRHIFGQARVNRINWTVPLLVLLGLIFITFEIHSALTPFMSVLLFPILILAASARTNLIGRLVSSKPLVAIGSASYSLYLMQAPVQKAVKPLARHVVPADPAVATLIIGFYLSTLAAGTFLVYQFIERPMRRKLRKRLTSSDNYDNTKLSRVTDGVTNRLM